MKNAEFIGLEAINENLESLNFDALGVYQGKLEKFKTISSEDEEEADLILSFNKWAERMLNSNPINSQLYSIQLYDKPSDGFKNLRGTTSFTFMLAEPKIFAQAKNNNGNNNQMGGKFISENELNLALKNQQLEFENQLLAKQLEEEEEEEDEMPQLGMMGAVQEAVMSRLPSLIDLLITQFTPQSNRMTQSHNLGIGASVDEIISEFRTINPDIEMDLLKLLELAKNKPSLFKMLIAQLREL